MRESVLNDWEEFGLLAVALTGVYVFLQLLAHVGGGKLAFILLLLAVVVIARVTEYDLVTIVVPLIVLQQTHPFGPGWNVGRNWISGNLLTISLVYYVLAAIALTLAWHIYRTRELYVDQYTATFTLALLVSSFLSHIGDLRMYLYEIAVLGAIPLLSLYVQNVARLRARRRLRDLVLVAPVAIVVGDLLLRGASVIVGVQLYPRLTTIVLFIVAVILGAVAEADADVHVRIAYGVVAVLFLIQFLWTAIQMKSGSIVLLGLVLACLAGTGKLWRRSGYDRRIPVALGCVLLAGAAVVTLVPSIVPEYIVYKIVSMVWSLITLDLQGMAHSPAVRVIEVVNILVYEMSHGPSHAIFGMGPGGYFTDAFLPFERFVELGPSDYGKVQRQTSHFYSPHNTPGYVLLKLGLFGVLVTAALIVRSGKEYFRQTGSLAILSLALFLIAGAVIGYGVKNGIVAGTILGLLGASAFGQRTIRW